MKAALAISLITPDINAGNASLGFTINRLVNDIKINKVNDLLVINCINTRAIVITNNNEHRVCCVILFT